MLLYMIYLFIFIDPIVGIYQSMIRISSTGYEYQAENAVQLIVSSTIETQMLCVQSCHSVSSCRTFDYDVVSKRCRLFEGDSRTGSIISSSSSSSIVGTEQISSDLYSSIHDQTCSYCINNRYEICSTDTNSCQCPLHTYWNGSICLLKLFENQTCDRSDACRDDLNLSCTMNCYGEYTTCQMAIPQNTALNMRFGITVAGGCNGSSSTNQTLLNDQSDVALDFDNTLYVTNYDNRLLSFPLNNRTGRTLQTFSKWPGFMYFDRRTSNLYITIIDQALVYVWPTNQTIPPSGISRYNCSFQWLWTPTGITVDSNGTVYISDFNCNWVTKWLPNATSGTLVVGSPLGLSGATSQRLYAPYGLALDEINSYLYVADRYNNRIQRFRLNGSDIGETILGTVSAGSGANQVYRPTDIYLSKIDASLYICDCSNNRIQKWFQNQTYAITIAGNPNGTSGNTPYLLNQPYGFTFDYQEKYLYVSDSSNNRIQRFSL